jgi:phytoene dehydrogenase-like protein
MTNARETDAIVIGAGPNGLACAAYLAEAGKRVILVEARDEIGGGARRVSITDGYTVPGCAQHAWVSRRLVRDLKLTRHGLKFTRHPMALIALDPEGRHIRLESSGKNESLARHNSTDAANYRSLNREFRLTAEFVNSFCQSQPSYLPSDYRSLPSILAGLSGGRQIAHILRHLATPLGDFLDARLDTNLVKGALSCLAALGASCGPREPSSMLHFLYQLCGPQGMHAGSALLPVGGPPAFVAALAAVCSSLGVEIRTRAKVERLLFSEDRVSGVMLGDGTRLAAPYVASSLPTHVTYGALLGPRALSTNLNRRLRRPQVRGFCGKLHLALDGLPHFKGLSDFDLSGRLIVAPEVDYVERAMNAASQNEFAFEPAMEITLPSLRNPSSARPGHHVLSATVIGLPYEIAGGWPARRDECVKSILNVIGTYAPDIGSRIIVGDFLTPADIEMRFGMPGGDWHHGGLSFSSLGPWRNPSAPGNVIEGLDLCGAGAHPGGGVSGLAGYLAARRAISGRKSVS